MSELIVHETHRALWYEDGKLTKVLGAGRYLYPKASWFERAPKIDITLVDMRERDLTIKGQEILTADKVSLRVSILVQFRVTDPKAAILEVESYEDRLYSDVQLAARRSLASMTLDEILTNRNQLSEEILADVQETASGYGVAIRRADVKDLIFPGNLQEIMNQVLSAQRKSEAQLVMARTQAEVEKLEAISQSEIRQAQSRAETESERLHRQMEIDLTRQSAVAETETLNQRQQLAELIEAHPGLLKWMEIESIKHASENGNTKIYIGMDRPRDASIPEAE